MAGKQLSISWTLCFLSLCEMLGLAILSVSVPNMGFTKFVKNPPIVGASAAIMAPICFFGTGSLSMFVTGGGEGYVSLTIKLAMECVCPSCVKKCKKVKSVKVFCTFVILLVKEKMSQKNLVFKVTTKLLWNTLYLKRIRIGLIFELMK